MGLKSGDIDMGKALSIAIGYVNNSDLGAIKKNGVGNGKVLKEGYLHG